MKLLAVGYYIQVIGEINKMIPERYQNEIGLHIIGNILRIDNYPLILAIFGEPGMGKTFQLREHLKYLNIRVFSINAADLENEYAGVPAKLLREQYINASAEISNGQPAAIVIDDIDTTVGEWERNTGTVNHQEIIAFLMHLADNPNFIENIGYINRVPTFVTGNNYNLMYEPLRRPGRAKLFEWEPTEDEKIDIIVSIFKTINRGLAKKIVNKFPDKPISYFSELYATYCTKSLLKYASNASINYLLQDERYRDSLYNQYINALDDIDWYRVICK